MFLKSSYIVSTGTLLRKEKLYGIIPFGGGPLTQTTTRMLCLDMSGQVLLFSVKIFNFTIVTYSSESNHILFFNEGLASDRSISSSGIFKLMV